MSNHDTNNPKDQTPGSTQQGLPRRTFLKRASGMALAFTVVDLVTAEATTMAGSICEGKKYASEPDGNCNGSNNPNVYNRDQGCDAFDPDGACGAPVPNNKIEGVPPGSTSVFYDKDQSCVASAPSGSAGYDESKNRDNQQLVN